MGDEGGSVIPVLLQLLKDDYWFVQVAGTNTMAKLAGHGK